MILRLTYEASSEDLEVCRKALDQLPSTTTLQYGPTLRIVTEIEVEDLDSLAHAMPVLEGMNLVQASVKFTDVNLPLRRRKHKPWEIFPTTNSRSREVRVYGNVHEPFSPKLQAEFGRAFAKWVKRMDRVIKRQKQTRGMP